MKAFLLAAMMGPLASAQVVRESHCERTLERYYELVRSSARAEIRSEMAATSLERAQWHSRFAQLSAEREALEQAFIAVCLPK